MPRRFLNILPWLLTVVLAGLLVWVLYLRMYANIRADEYRREALMMQEELYRVKEAYDSLEHEYRGYFRFKVVEGSGSIFHANPDSISFNAYIKASGQEFAGPNTEYLVAYEQFDTNRGLRNPIDTFFIYKNRRLTVSRKRIYGNELYLGINVQSFPGYSFMLPVVIPIGK